MKKLVLMLVLGLVLFAGNAANNSNEVVSDVTPLSTCPGGNGGIGGNCAG